MAIDRAKCRDVIRAGERLFGTGGVDPDFGDGAYIRNPMRGAEVMLHELAHLAILGVAPEDVGLPLTPSSVQSVIDGERSRAANAFVCIDQRLIVDDCFEAQACGVVCAVSEHLGLGLSEAKIVDSVNCRYFGREMAVALARDFVDRMDTTPIERFARTVISWLGLDPQGGRR